MRKYLIIGLLLLFFSCDKEDNLQPFGKSIDFYVLSEYQTIENSFKIIDSTAKLSDYNIIGYSDIISYSSKTYTFTVNNSISDRLNDFENNSIHGTPFALTVDNEIIYTGYFWAGYSSMSCDWITIDPLDYSGNHELTVQLGYPGLMQGDYIPDNRNDSRIINTLKHDNKLIE